MSDTNLNEEEEKKLFAERFYEDFGTIVKGLIVTYHKEFPFFERSIKDGFAFSIEQEVEWPKENMEFDVKIEIRPKRSNKGIKGEIDMLLYQQIELKKEKCLK